MPWSHGRQLAWDATCVDPLCMSNIVRSSKVACSAVEKAVLSKRRGYVCGQYWFVAFGGFGGWSNEARDFSRDLGRRMVKITLFLSTKGEFDNSKRQCIQRT